MIFRRFISGAFMKNILVPNLIRDCNTRFTISGFSMNVRAPYRETGTKLIITKLIITKLIITKLIITKLIITKLIITKLIRYKIDKVQN